VAVAAAGWHSYSFSRRPLMAHATFPCSQWSRPRQMSWYARPLNIRGINSAASELSQFCVICGEIKDEIAARLRPLAMTQLCSPVSTCGCKIRFFSVSSASLRWINFHHASWHGASGTIRKKIYFLCVSVTLWQENALQAARLKTRLIYLDISDNAVVKSDFVTRNP
jgi:hypothetical protein